MFYLSSVNHPFPSPSGVLSFDNPYYSATDGGNTVGSDFDESGYMDVEA